MRISDWSSDVCSSDLFLVADPVEDVLEHRFLGFRIALEAQVGDVADHLGDAAGELAEAVDGEEQLARVAEAAEQADLRAPAREIGRAACRERMCQYV